jgi:hypothetical protein
MFLTRCRPAGSKSTSSLPRTGSWTLAAHPYPARLAQGLDPGRHVDAVAVDVGPVDHHVAEVDPDPVADALASGTPASRSAIARWISTAASTAATTLPNSTMAPSPLRSTNRPPYRSRTGSTSSLRIALSRATCRPRRAP